MDLPSCLRRPILDPETRARVMGLALVRAVENGSGRQVTECGAVFLQALIDLPPSEGGRALALEIRQYVHDRIQAARGLPPITLTADVTIPPIPRRSLARRLAERLADALCKGA